MTVGGPSGLGSISNPPVVTEPDTSTPLDDGEPHGAFPTPLLWAMKEHRRFHLDLSHEPHGERLGTDADGVWVIDTDHGHCTIGRVEGQGPDGVVYCLVATIKGDTYVGCSQNPAAVSSIFTEARHPILVGVFEGGVSNVFDVRRYESSSEILADFLPPNPPIDFAEDPVPDEFG